MGDFYELFFDDAVVAAEALQITLTKRGKHLGEDIPMCGVPVVRADEYLQRLIRFGYRVAVCEQLEDPAEARKRGSKAIVRRDVVRLVTPGTLTEDALLDAKSRNFLAAVMVAVDGAGDVAGDVASLGKGSGKGLGKGSSHGTVAIAAFELSTGELEIGTVALSDVPGELARLLPREVLRADTRDLPSDVTDALSWIDAAVTPVPAPSFDSLAGQEDLTSGLGVRDLAAFGSFSRAELATVGALLRYVDLTQVGKRAVICPPKRLGAGANLVIDAATRGSLELVRTASGDRKGSLLAAMDRTVTGAGARELASRIAAPLVDPTKIAARHDALAHFVGQDILRGDLRDVLKTCPDLARAMSRLSLQRGGPRDLGAVRQGLRAAQTIFRILSGTAAAALPDQIARILNLLSAVDPALLTTLESALADELPHLKREGNFVAAGYAKELDAARSLRDDSRAVIASLEAKYTDLSGIKALKVRHNNIMGYFVEATAATAKPLTEPPLAGTFRHRQTLANAMRFTTDELVDLEGRIASAAERVQIIENELFAALSDHIRNCEADLVALTAALAELDCVTALGELAAEQGYVRPTIHTDRSLAILGGRHPVVEQALQRQHAGPFIVNECILGETENADRPPGFEDTGTGIIWLVTGPNMAGKSTFLRQNALIVVMAQMGSFVPADQARIGIVDRLFSRVGASDDLARGRSTFMVEMVETAAILNQATPQSLVVLDEIGRGTATFDGLSIAWAAVEHLHDEIGCRALFATHYHEMTALSDRLAGVANVTMDVKEFQDDIVFLHRVRPGAADRSYGIQVARLAGLPTPVVQRAREVLERLEASDKTTKDASPLDDLPLFSAARPKSVTPNGGADRETDTALSQAVDDIHPDELTPRAALDVVYKLKALRRDQAT